MKILLIAMVLVLLTGCYAAQYSVKKYDPVTGNVIADFEVKSRRQLEQLKVDYDGKNQAFVGSVGKATSTPSPAEQAIADLMPALIYQYGQAMGRPYVPTIRDDGN